MKLSEASFNLFLKMVDNIITCLWKPRTALKKFKQSGNATLKSNVPNLQEPNLFFVCLQVEHDVNIVSINNDWTLRILSCQFIPVLADFEVET